MNTISTDKKYIRYKYLYIAENQNEVIFLGYKLEVTKTEYKILKELAKSPNIPLSAEQIAIKTELDLSKENVAYHIHSINKKAKIISNRCFIKNIAKNGYFLS